jgi:hypothetical protein
MKQLIEVCKALPDYRETIPFVVLSGPSGVGKTQTAFALAASRLVVVHLIYSRLTTDNCQLVYEDSLRISGLFLNCVDRDLQQRVFSAEDLKCTEPLFSFGFVVWCLEMLRIRSNLWLLQLEEEKVGIHPCSWENAMERINQCKQRPLFFFDEVGPLTTEGSNRFQFVRNVFRALKLVVLFAGTNTSAANMLQIKLGSRGREGAPSPWAYVMLRFPKFAGDSKDVLAKLQQHHPALHEFISAALPTELPLMVVRVLDEIGKLTLEEVAAMSSVDLLQRLLQSVHSRLVEEKPAWVGANGLRAQVASLQTG